MKTKMVQGIDYQLVEPEKLQEFIDRMAEKEWEPEDFEKYGKDSHNSQWRLEEGDLDKIKMRPELLTDLEFQQDLQKRIEKQRKLHANNSPIPHWCCVGRIC